MFPANIRNFTPAMLELYILRSSFNAVLILSSIKEIANAVNSGIEASLLFNFWTFGKVLYLSFYPLLFNKNPNFHDFFSLLFVTVFYSKQFSIPEFYSKTIDFN